jgi:hypothetical protein
MQYNLKINQLAHHIIITTERNFKNIIKDYILLWGNFQNQMMQQ